MNAVRFADLELLYRNGDDPWAFRTSDYEQAKFRATSDALAKALYHSGLEIGCGNGELARHIAPRCDNYTGLDAMPVALAAAQRAVPEGCFVQGYLPCRLPDGPHDLIVLSEILYFLDKPCLTDMADQISRRWPAAEVLAVTWLGPSGNPLQGDEALAIFTDALLPALSARPILQTDHFRIDRYTAT